jgi:hypothetical protein
VDQVYSVGESPKSSGKKNAMNEGGMKLSQQSDPLDRPLVFVSGAPRSGTSLVTKVIDAHPDIAVLMENIFGNRRRHWMKANFWNSSETLRREVEEVFKNLEEPIVGNKVCTPDVWSADDIMMFCNLFKDFKIVFVVRDPVQVALSRLNREDYEAEFNEDARHNMLLDFRSRFLTYASSWRQSIESYWKLRDGHPGKVYLLYYEDFCNQFEFQLRTLCDFLQVSFSANMLNWHQLPHHDARGNLKRDIKYKDAPVAVHQSDTKKLAEVTRNALSDALLAVKWQRDLWQAHQL